MRWVINGGRGEREGEESMSWTSIRLGDKYLNWPGCHWYKNLSHIYHVVNIVNEEVSRR